MKKPTLPRSCKLGGVGFFKGVFVERGINHEKHELS